MQKIDEKPLDLYAASFLIGDFYNWGFWDFGTTNVRSETIDAH